MIWHVIAHENSEDDFSIVSVPEGKLIRADLSGADRKIGIQNTLGYVFDDFGAYPSESATDLLRLGMAVFTADKSVKRKEAFNKWSRYIHLYQPVTETELWNGIKEKLEKTLNFLTGDHWELHFRTAKQKSLISPKQLQVKIPDQKKQSAAIALMSGGLDSFAGAIDLLETTPESVVFVSHYGRGGITKIAQDNIYTLLRHNYPNRFCPLQFFIQPSSEEEYAEPSQRSRSFLFLSLGVAVSSTSNDNLPLHIYENGLLSLNVPLTANRGGGLSTRTTHPHFLSMFQDITNSLGIKVSITTPFRFLTKGELLLTSKNPKVLREGIKQTHSCSHTTYVRFTGNTMDNHCGYCLPCIVRRAATNLAGFDDVNYVVDILKDELPPSRVEGKDLFAVKIALRRLDTMSSSLLSRVRTAGPLHGTQEEISQYVDIYRRGMAELKKLLG